MDNSQRNSQSENPASRPSTTSRSVKQWMTSLVPCTMRSKRNSNTVWTMSSRPTVMHVKLRFRTASQDTDTSEKPNSETSWKLNTVPIRTIGPNVLTSNINPGKQRLERRLCLRWMPNCATSASPTRPIWTFSRKKPRLSWKLKWKSAFGTLRLERKKKLQLNLSANLTSVKKSCETRLSLMFVSENLKSVLKLKVNLA